MSAPATTAPIAAVRPRRIGPGTNHDFWADPATALAGALTGLMLRGWLTAEARFAVVVVLLALVVVAAAVVLAGAAVLRRYR